jgi:thiol-disulfide isomerase/thioredoxin
MWLTDPEWEEIMIGRIGQVLGMMVGISGILLSSPLSQASEALAFIGMKAPDVVNQVWLNGEFRSMQDLRGKVVLVEFWTFGCYNCRNVEPFVKAWYQKYHSQGLEVIGVHSPEFKYEHNIESVKRYLGEHDIRYPVVIDNDFSTWNRYGNRYWPAIYLIDKKGVIRYTRAGEGGYDQTEQQIQRLLAEVP